MTAERLHLVVEGKTYVVEVDDLAVSPLTVRVNGKPFTVKVAGEGAVAASDSPVAATAEAVSPPSISQGGFAAQAVTAPMPGNILDIAVKPGDCVTYKQLLCNLEAMKMKNPLRSPRNGVIADVHVLEGQVVAYGDLLFTFE